VEKDSEFRIKHNLHPTDPFYNHKTRLLINILELCTIWLIYIQCRVIQNTSPCKNQNLLISHDHLIKGYFLVLCHGEKYPFYAYGQWPLKAGKCNISPFIDSSMFYDHECFRTNFNPSVQKLRLNDLLAHHIKLLVAGLCVGRVVTFLKLRFHAISELFILNQNDISCIL
jgi:hypothetical protein